MEMQNTVSTALKSGENHGMSWVAHGARTGCGGKSYPCLWQRAGRDATAEGLRALLICRRVHGQGDAGAWHPQQMCDELIEGQKIDSGARSVVHGTHVGASGLGG